MRTSTLNLSNYIQGLTNYKLHFLSDPHGQKKVGGTEFLSPAQAARHITNCPELQTPDNILQPPWHISGQINNFGRQFEFFIVHVCYYLLHFS